MYTKHWTVIFNVEKVKDLQQQEFPIFENSIYLPEALQIELVECDQINMTKFALILAIEEDFLFFTLAVLM